jgi:hypothetical protein
MSVDELRSIISELVKIPALWDAEDIGVYLKVQTRTVSENYAKQKGFPSAIRIGGQSRWKPEEIMEWADGKRIKRRKTPVKSDEIA